MAVVRSIRSPVSTAADLTPILDSLTAFGEKAQNRFRQEASVKLQDEATRKASTAIAAGEPIPAPKEQGLFSSPLVDVYNKALQDVYLVDAVNKYETDLGRYRTELDNRPAVDENGQPLDKTADMHAYASQSREALTKALEENGLTAGVATEFQRVSLNSLQRHLGAMQDKAVQASYAYAQNAAEETTLQTMNTAADQLLGDMDSLDLVENTDVATAVIATRVEAVRAIAREMSQVFPNSGKLQTIISSANDFIVDDLVGRATAEWGNTLDGIEKLQQLNRILYDGGYYEDNQQPRQRVVEATNRWSKGAKDMLGRRIAEMDGFRGKAFIETVIGSDLRSEGRWELIKTAERLLANPDMPDDLKEMVNYAVWQEAVIATRVMGLQLPDDHPLKGKNLSDSQAIPAAYVDNAEKLSREIEQIRQNPDALRFKLADAKASVEGPRIDTTRLLAQLDANPTAGAQEIRAAVGAAFSAPDLAVEELTGRKPKNPIAAMSPVDKANMGSLLNTAYERFRDATPDQREKHAASFAVAVQAYIDASTAADPANRIAPMRRLVLKDNPTLTADQASLLDTYADLLASGDMDSANTLLAFSVAPPTGELPETEKIRADNVWSHLTDDIRDASTALNFGAVNVSADLESSLKATYYNMVAAGVPDAKSRISRMLSTMVQDSADTQVIEGEALHRKAYVRIPKSMRTRGNELVSRLMSDPAKPWMPPDQQARLGRTSQIVFVPDGDSLALFEKAPNGTVSPITLATDVEEGYVLMGGGVTTGGGSATTIWKGSSLRSRKAGDPVVITPTKRGP